MLGWMISLLIGQTVCALIGLDLLRRRVYPALRLGRSDQPGLITDVWLPLALVVPMLCLAGRIDGSVAGFGWVPIGGPVGVGLVGLGWAMWRRGEGAGARETAPRLAAALGLAGVILLLLGAAHTLTVWTGQCTFAIAAVLLWMNTPHPGPRIAVEDAAPAGRPGGWLSLVVLLAGGQGVLALATAGPWARASAILMLAYALAGVVIAAHTAGPGWGLRIAGWVAGLGTLLGIGTLSLIHLTRESVALIVGDRAHIDVHVARGFGTYAVEGTLLLVVAIAAVAAARPRDMPRRAVGVALAVAGAGLIAWRLRGLG